MRGVHRVEAMLDAELYESWQEYLAHHRRTGQKELRWLIEKAVEGFYEDRARARRLEAMVREEDRQAALGSADAAFNRRLKEEADASWR